MKAKTIEKVIGKKFDYFLESIVDEKVKVILKESTIITGGCITSMLLNEEVNDYDLYFRNLESATIIANYFVKLFNSNKKSTHPITVRNDGGKIKVVVKSAGISSESSIDGDYRFFETLDPGSPEQDKFVDGVMEVVAKDKKDPSIKYKPIFLTSNAITLSDEIQLIFRFYGEPDDIHKNYDFLHCTNYWTSWDKKLILNKEALQSILTKELIYSGSLYPICSIMRIRKFIGRGWTINAGQIFKICYQISKLNLDDINVLREQLIGVDIAYFLELLYLLKENKENKPIDYIYLCELIDRIW